MASLRAPSKGSSDASSNPKPQKPASMSLPLRQGNPQQSSAGLTRKAQYYRASQAVEVLANYFEVFENPDAPLNFHLYSISFIEEPKTKRLRRRALFCLFSQWEKENETDDGKWPFCASNWNNLLMTTKEIDKDLLQFNLPFHDEDESAPRPKCKNFLIELAKLNTFHSNDVFGTTTPSAHVISALNIMFAACANAYSSRTPKFPATTVVIGADKFFAIDEASKSARFELKGGLEARRGYFRSVRYSEKPLVNLSVVTGAFYSSLGTLSDLIKSWVKQNREIWPAKDLSAFLKGVRFITTHLGKTKKSNEQGKKAKSLLKNERIYSIKSIATARNASEKPTPGRVFFEQTQDNGNTREVSVAAYYDQVYQPRIFDPDCVVIQCGSDDHPVYFPSGVCKVLPGQPYTQPVSSAEMVDAACLTPKDGAHYIREEGLWMLGIGGGDDEIHCPASFNVSLRREMITIQGRILSAPKVLYGQGLLRPERVAGGSWAMTGMKFTKPTAGVKWSFLQLVYQGGSVVDDENLRYNIDQIGIHMNDYGMARHELIVPTANFRNLTLRGNIKFQMQADERENEDRIARRLNHLKTQGIRLIFVVLPDKSPNGYAMVKRVGDLVLGMNTICAVANNQRKKGNEIEPGWRLKDDYAFLANLMLKVNLKLRGVNQWLGEEFVKSGILSSNTMFIGIDCTHPGPGAQNNAPSIAAVVATEEPVHFAQWPASIRLQLPQRGKESREVVDELKNMVMERLVHWKTKNKNILPRQIIIYRDGVSESFFPIVKEQEWPQITAAIAQQYGLETKNHPKMALLLNVKRHHTRFYAKDRTPARMLDKTGNFVPGLLVSSGITSTTEKDFFLQSHQSIKGTAKPAHYYILKNDLPYPEEALKAMTHDMCYLFGRCTRSVSIHPASYYADLVCDRVRSCYLRRVYVPYEQGQNFDLDRWPSNKFVPDFSVLGSAMYYI